jgi:lactose/L-arabinose transport system substrate-binding protein
MKKIGIAAIMILLAGMMMFTSCKKQQAAQSSANSPVTITVWCWDPNFNIYAINEAAKIYKGINPNVTINCVEVPWDDIQQRLITAFTARQYNDLPDIILMQDNAIQKNVTTYPDRFLPVNDKVNLSQFAQYKLDVGNYNGKNYGVPFDNGATGTFIRRDIVENAGLKVSDFDNITWERFYELGKQVKQRTGLPMLSVDVGSPDFIMIMLQSAGTWLFDNQGKAYIKNNPALRRATELFAQGLQEGTIIQAADWNSYISSLNNGSVVATVQGAWIVGSITAEASQSGKWAVVSTPRIGNISSSVNYSSNGGSGWMVLANSKNPDAAMDFLDKTFAGSVQLYETILPSSGAIATWLPAANSTVYSQPHAFFGGQKIFEDLVNYAGKVPKVKYGIYNYEARSAVARNLPDIVGGRMTIDAALDAAQNEVEFILNQ